MAPRKHSDEIRAAAIAAYKTKEKTEDICARLHISKGSLQRFVKSARLRLRHQYNKRQQTIRLSMGNPRLGPTAIAKEIGATINYVKRVRAECGLRKCDYVALQGAATPNQSGFECVVS